MELVKPSQHGTKRSASEKSVHLNLWPDNFPCNIHGVFVCSLVVVLCNFLTTQHNILSHFFPFAFLCRVRNLRVPRDSTTSRNEKHETEAEEKSFCREHGKLNKK